jgi:serine protease Do
MLSLRFPQMKVVTGVLALALCLAAVDTARAQGDVHAKLQRSSAFIVVDKGNNQVSYGSGWIYDQKQNLVITNYHVVANADKALVAFGRYDNKGAVLTNSSAYGKTDYIPGKVLARDSKRDLALIKLDRLPKGTVALVLATASIEPGQKIFSIGNSGMAGKNLDAGSLWRKRTGTVKSNFYWMITLKGANYRLEASVFATNSGSKPGDSGGPVVDASGRLVGVNFAGTDDLSSDDAIDVSEVRVFVARALGTAPKAPHKAAGTWTLTWKHQGKELYAGLTLETNGTAVWYGSSKQKGTYTFANDQLGLEVPNSMTMKATTLKWVNNNQFTFTVQFSDGSTTFTAVRR